MHVKAGDLTDALRSAKPRALKKKSKPVPVSLEQDIVTGNLSVIEATHGLFAKVIASSGDFPPRVQIDGATLERLASSWPAEVMLELTAETDRLVIRAGKSQLAIQRLDGVGRTPIKRTASPPNKKHKGKVVVPPDPVHKRVELADTWAFSARVPMRQHRDPSDKT